MLIIGLDYHPSFQYIAFVETETGECGERRLQHPDEAQQFYRELHHQGIQVRIGMEASGHSRWFERLITELGFELLIADPAQVRARQVRKHKTDRQDAELLLRLTMKDELPQIYLLSAWSWLPFSAVIELIAVTLFATNMAVTFVQPAPPVAFAGK